MKQSRRPMPIRSLPDSETPNRLKPYAKSSLRPLLVHRGETGGTGRNARLLAHPIHIAYLDRVTPVSLSASDNHHTSSMSPFSTAVKVQYKSLSAAGVAQLCPCTPHSITHASHIDKKSHLKISPCQCRLPLKELAWLVVQCRPA